MKTEGEIWFEILPNGDVKMQIKFNDSPDHGQLLKPFTSALADGDKSRVIQHLHDHGHEHGQHTHTHGGH